MNGWSGARAGFSHCSYVFVTTERPVDPHQLAGFRVVAGDTFFGAPLFLSDRESVDDNKTRPTFAYVDTPKQFGRRRPWLAMPCIAAPRAPGRKPWETVSMGN